MQYLLNIQETKENDNLQFLSFSIKDLLSYGKEEKLKNRQYSNHILIKCLEKKELATKDKAIFFELINFLNNSVENEISLMKPIFHILI